MGAVTNCLTGRSCCEQGKDRRQFGVVAGVPQAVSNEVGMTVHRQPKAPMPAGKGMTDSGASQEARRATEDVPGSAHQDPRPGTDSKLIALAQRRNFSPAHQAWRDRCADAPRGHFFVRAEHLAAPTRQRRPGRAGAAKARTQGADPHRAETLHIAQLTRERDSLESRLDKALLVIDVQKNWPSCWAIRPTAPSCRDGRGAAT